MPGPAYLLDTDWIIDHLSGVEAVSRKILELDQAGLAVSIVSLAELYEGVYFARDPEKSLDSLRRFLNGINVIGLEEDIARGLAKSEAGCAGPAESLETSIF